MATPLVVSDVSQDLHHAPARRHRACRSSADVSLRRRSRRMRRARRPVRRRQELDPEDGLRQLCRRRRPDPRRASRPAGRPRHRRPAHGAGGPPRHASAMSASSCASCRASRRSTSSPSRWSPAASTRARRASAARGAAGPAQPAASGSGSLPPATFSGGEQQRVNIARGFITDHPVLLLDEPTASLDAANRAVVVEMIARQEGGGRRAARHLPRRGRARGRSPTAIVDVTALRRRKVAA